MTEIYGMIDYGIISRYDKLVILPSLRKRSFLGGDDVS